MGSNASDENIWASTRVHNANREETNTEASLLNTPLAVPLTTLSTSNATPTAEITGTRCPPSDPVF